MKAAAVPSGSIRRRLLLSMLALAAVLSGLLYLTVRGVAARAVEATQDAVLGSAGIAIAEELRGTEDGVEIDIPYTAFSMLGAVGQDRVFYRVLIGDVTLTGYADLPLPAAPPSGLTPLFYSTNFQDETVRIAAVERAVLSDGRPVSATVLVAQTRTAAEAIAGQLANRAALLGLGVFALAALLAVVTARSVLAPVDELAEAVRRRGPQDLRPVARAVPVELAPFVTALNGFMGRLSAALSRTETFIAEAAHHIRTPLAVVRAEAEIALRQAPDDATRARMRSVIRAVDDSARSATQLLDHATVVYRTDQRTDEDLDLGELARSVTQALAPAADLKEIALDLEVGEGSLVVRGDRLLIESALRNLLDNAVKYSGPETEVRLTVAAVAGGVRVRVEDRGRGLGGSQPAALTARFRRGTNVDDIIGSGLGLTIVKEVARAQRGAFRLTDREGGGTCADLFLPAH
jgi:two-component system sensor histidine kinase TctE